MATWDCSNRSTYKLLYQQATLQHAAKGWRHLLQSRLWLPCTTRQEDFHCLEDCHSLPCPLLHLPKTWASWWPPDIHCQCQQGPGALMVLLLGPDRHRSLAQMQSRMEQIYPNTCQGHSPKCFDPCPPGMKTAPPNYQCGEEKIVNDLKGGGNLRVWRSQTEAANLLVMGADSPGRREFLPLTGLIKGIELCTRYGLMCLNPMWHST